MTQLKLNSVAISKVNCSLVSDSTKMDTGVVKRNLAALTFLSQNVGRVLPKEDVNHALRLANLIGFPNQDRNSQNIYANRVMAAWKRIGVIEVVDN